MKRSEVFYCCYKLIKPLTCNRVSFFDLKLCVARWPTMQWRVHMAESASAKLFGRQSESASTKPVGGQSKRSNSPYASRKKKLVDAQAAHCMANCEAANYLAD
ncbi:hypothetical protein J1N35_017676 [Gossypium stocksii]|uniref:Uncharacterized protein n=1 Tax=Gossypium stocksii TaxID=47602 RepID=A0A9D3VMU2_9ROSI|nr:hypothetical protein J1N35_017676 [Gossypium stocksii]